MNYQFSQCANLSDSVENLLDLLQQSPTLYQDHTAIRASLRKALAPLIAILVEALYYLANELENVLVEASENVVKNFCKRLRERIKQQKYYRQLHRLLGNDSDLEKQIQQLEKDLIQALVSEAKTECDRYVRESPRFYDEGTFSIYQFRETLKQTSQSYDCASMVQAEPAIRQLLKLDFEPKVSNTISRNFRQTINQTLKTQLLPMAKEQTDIILQKYPEARANLEKTLEVEAIAKIASNQKLQQEIMGNIQQYNLAVSDIKGNI